MTFKSSACRVVAVLMAALGLAHGMAAIVRDKPWSKEIIKRVEHGKVLQLSNYITIGTWYAAIAGAVLCLAGASALWFARAPQPVVPEAPPKSSKAFRWGLAIVLLMALVIRLPKAGHSLWNDELRSLEMFVIGETVQRDARHDFSDSWQRATFANPEANNHLLCTIETRIAHGLWRAIDRPKAGEQPFSERWLRLPALLWGMLGIMLAGHLGRLQGGARLGLMTAALLAVHPWHVRFSTEARGYAAAMTCIVLIMLALHHLLVQHDRRWRWWLVLCAAHALCLMAYVASAPVLAGIDGVACIALLRRRDWHGLSWLLAACALGATCFLDFSAPGLLQVSAFLKDKAEGFLAPISRAWWQDIASAFTCGEDWHRGWLGMKRQPAWQMICLLAGGCTLLLAGVLEIFRHGTPAMKAACAAWGCGLVITLAQNILGHQAMLSWYLCPLLPGLALCVASALSSEDRPTFLVAIIAVAAWLCAVSPVLWSITQHPRQPVRDAAAWVKANAAGSFIVYLGISDQHIDPYLPSVHVLAHGPQALDSASQVKAWEAAAAAADQPFIVVFGGHAESREPEVARYLTSSGYRTLAAFAGADDIYDIEVRGRE